MQTGPLFWFILKSNVQHYKMPVQENFTFSTKQNKNPKTSTNQFKDVNSKYDELMNWKLKL